MVQSVNVSIKVLTVFTKSLMLFPNFKPEKGHSSTRNVIPKTAHVGNKGDTVFRIVTPEGIAMTWDPICVYCNTTCKYKTLLSLLSIQDQKTTLTCLLNINTTLQ